MRKQETVESDRTVCCDTESPKRTLDSNLTLRKNEVSVSSTVWSCRCDDTTSLGVVKDRALELSENQEGSGFHLYCMSPYVPLGIWALGHWVVGRATKVS